MFLTVITLLLSCLSEGLLQELQYLNISISFLLQSCFLFKKLFKSPSKVLTPLHCHIVQYELCMSHKFVFYERKLLSTWIFLQCVWYMCIRYIESILKTQDSCHITLLQNKNHISLPYSLYINKLQNSHVIIFQMPHVFFISGPG